MKTLTGLTIFLIVLYIALIIAVPPQGFALNNYNLAERIGQYGIISLGAGLVIIAGGIDLSIGSVVVLAATTCAILLTDKHFGLDPMIAIPLVLAGGAI